MRRDLTGAALIAMVLLGVLPAYDRVFSDPGWRAPAIAATLLALTVAVVCRRAHRGGLFAAVASLAAATAFLPWLNALTTRPVVPGPAAIGALSELSSRSLIELAQTPAPAPSLAGLVLAVTAGTWVVTHASHELAVRLARPGLALVPLAVLWAAPLVVPMAPDRTWPQTVPFLAATALFLLLTASAEQGTAPETVVSPAGLALGAVAIVGAVLAPSLLPGYEASPWMALGNASSSRGYQPIVDISDRLRLPEERDVLRVHASQRTYLRLAGLDSFDGFTWRLGDGEGSYRPDPSALYPAQDVLPPEQPAGETEPVFVDVEVLELENIYVPVPYQPVEVLGPHRDEMVWSTEGGFVATWDTTPGGTGEARVGVREGLSYRVRAARPTPTFDELVDAEVPPELLERWTRLPREYPRLREQAEAVYAAAGAETAVDRALALQDWFVGREGGFTYDLDVPALRGDDALEAFVLEDRVGYCEYYATAMAVMLRETGIPARVAVGFLPGRVTREADPSVGRELTEFTVSTSDAHAWVEVLFPGRGWVAFEPTPRSDQTQIVPTADDLTPTENLRERRAREREQQRQDGAEDTTAPDRPEPLDDTSPNLPAETGAASPSTSAPGRDGEGRWGVVLLLLAAGLSVVVVAVRRRPASSGASGSPRERVLSAQRRLLATGRRYGMGRRPQETTREVLERWHREHRIDARGRRFAAVAQAAAFGGEVDDELATEVELLVEDLDRMLRESADRRDRLVGPVRIPAEHLAAGARRLVAGVGSRGEGPPR
jgi:transglutaminase-like putative cysteine protease